MKKETTTVLMLVLTIVSLCVAFLSLGLQLGALH
jgi:hypothetical protein